MSPVEFQTYVNSRTGATPAPPGPLVEWDEGAWRRHVEDVSGGAPGTYTIAMETAYLAGAWPTHAASAPTLAEIAARASYNSSTVYMTTPAATPPASYGVDMHPLITEIWADALSYSPPGAPTDQQKETAWENPANNFALELYNPYLVPLSIENLEIVVDTRNTGTVSTVSFARTFSTDIYPVLNTTTKVTTIPPGGRLILCRSASGMPPGAPLYVSSTFVIYPESRVYLRGKAFEANRTYSGNQVILDELRRPDNPLVWAQNPSGSAQDASRADLGGNFWLYSGAWYTLPSTSASLGATNNIAGPTAAVFHTLPSIANAGAASFASPADLCNLLTTGPDDDTDLAHGSLSSKEDPAWRTTDPRIQLFHRSYMTGTQDVPTFSPVAPIGAYQALMDFVTVVDFTHDSIDNDGNAIVDVTGAGPADPFELRIPGRLNINTVTQWNALDSVPLLLSVDPAVTPLSWRRLFDYRDKNDPAYAGGPATTWYSAVAPALYTPGNPSRRDNIVAGTPVPVRDATTMAERQAFQGFEQLGELCNLQLAGSTGFLGFWQGLDVNGSGPLPHLLPAQHIRRFARNANLLTTRSDTYMVTVRVEIVRPTPILDYINSPATTLPLLTAIEVLGQREFMYLADRSYCTRPPQQLPLGATDWGGLTNPNFNGRVEPAFTPPKVWRMTVPRYAAYGG